MSGFSIMFYVLAAMAMISATGVISFKNPIHSALSLVVTLIALAGLYVTLQGSFLGIIQVLTYGGAIMVLFIFIIMLLNLGENELHEKGYDLPVKLLLGAAALGLFLGLGYVLTHPHLPVTSLPEGFGEVAGIGRELFSTYVVPFELAGILLTVALIGAVLLAKRKLETK